MQNVCNIRNFQRGVYLPRKKVDRGVHLRGGTKRSGICDETVHAPVTMHMRSVLARVGMRVACAVARDACVSRARRKANVTRRRARKGRRYVVTGARAGMTTRGGALTS